MKFPVQLSVPVVIMAGMFSFLRTKRVMPHVTEGGRCSLCGKLASRSERWEARFCRGCVVWLEYRCADPVCPKCPKMPERPDPLAG